MAKAKRKAGARARAGRKAAKTAATRSKKTVQRPKARPTAAKKPARKTARTSTARPARKPAARKAPARKTATRKAAARRTSPRKATPRKTTTRKTTTRKTATRKTATRKTATRQAAARKTAAGVPVSAKRPSSSSAPPRTGRARAPRRAEPAHEVPPALQRTRRRLPEAEDLTLPTPPSSLDLDRTASAARSGRAEIEEALAEHTEAGPEFTAGDVDANWQSAYSTGDEAPGGDNPTPDQDVVDEIGKSLGLVYEDNEELKGADKITERDKHRWELDPASSEDYEDR
jgi:hypothetical protein